MREKREHVRAPLTASVVGAIASAFGEASTFQAESRDISIGGMFLSGKAPAAIGTEMTLSFPLPGLGAVILPAYIRWEKGDGFGVQFGLLGPRETHAIGRLLRASSHDLHRE